jgi:hypothetical protein
VSLKPQKQKKKQQRRKPPNKKKNNKPQKKKEKKPFFCGFYSVFMRQSRVIKITEIVVVLRNVSKFEPFLTEGDKHILLVLLLIYLSIQKCLLLIVSLLTVTALQLLSYLMTERSYRPIPIVT